MASKATVMARVGTAVTGVAPRSPGDGRRTTGAPCRFEHAHHNASPTGSQMSPHFQVDNLVDELVVLCESEKHSTWLTIEETTCRSYRRPQHRRTILAKPA